MPALKTQALLSCAAANFHEVLAEEQQMQLKRSDSMQEAEARIPTAPCAPSHHIFWSHCPSLKAVRVTISKNYSFYLFSEPNSCTGSTTFPQEVAQAWGSCHSYFRGQHSSHSSCLVVPWPAQRAVPECYNNLEACDENTPTAPFPSVKKFITEAIKIAFNARWELDRWQIRFKSSDIVEAFYGERNHNTQV